MFVKIKLESPTDVLSANKLNTSYFEIDEESTIGEVKASIEEHIDVPAEQLEIRTITQTLRNDKILKEIDELIKRDGSAVMLYVKGAGAFDEEPNFFGFLQFYSADEMAAQKDFEKRAADSADAKTGNPSSVSSTITLIEDAEPEYINNFLQTNEGSTTNSEFSNESDTSSSGTESSDSLTNRDQNESRKRRLVAAEKEKRKRAKRLTVIPNIPSSISTYLEEFPNYSKQTAGDITLVVPTIKRTAETTSQNICNTKNVETKEKEESNIPNTTTIDPIPCAVITPEIREFIVILSCSDSEGKIESKDCSELLASFFNIFKISENVKDLKFYEEAEPVLYKGLLWLTCRDEFTYNWTLVQANNLSRKYKSHKFIEYFNLKKCLTVIPCVDKNRSLFDVFHLLEQQNSGIKTAQWTVISRREILDDDEDDEFFERRISRLCSNDLFVLRIDQNSFDVLEKQNFKLNYCFWKIIFEISENSPA